MSDEHDHEHHGPHMFAFQVGPTPEQVEQMRMGAEASAHDVRAFLDGMTSDQLHMFGRVLRAIAGDESAATYYVGMTLGLLHAKFNICLACGKNHDEALADMVGPEETKSSKPAKRDAVTPLKEFHEKLADRDAQMVTFEVQLTTPEDRSLNPAVECIHCGTTWSSLEDRMLRKPGKGGCSTCIEKEKWG
jgi:hypothetical protein